MGVPHDFEDELEAEDEYQDPDHHYEMRPIIAGPARMMRVVAMARKKQAMRETPPKRMKKIEYV